MVLRPARISDFQNSRFSLAPPAPEEGILAAPPGRHSGRLLHGLVDQIRRTGRRLLQGGRGQVRVPLGHLGIRVPQDLLHLEQSTAAIHEHRGIGVPQIVDADVPQAGLVAQSVPDLLDGGVRLTRFHIDEQVHELILGIKTVQDTDGAVIQWHGAHFARLAIDRGDAPYSPFHIDVLPFCLQGFIESCPGAQQKQNDVADRAIAVRVQYGQQSPQLCGIQIVLNQIIFLVVLDAHHGVMTFFSIFVPFREIKTVTD